MSRTLDDFYIWGILRRQLYPSLKHKPEKTPAKQTGKHRSVTFSCNRALMLNTFP